MQTTFTKCVSAGTRVYYIDTHKDSKGSPYIVISEIPTDRSKGKAKRQRIFLHREHIDEFRNALSEAAEHIKGNQI